MSVTKEGIGRLCAVIGCSEIDYVYAGYRWKYGKNAPYEVIVGYVNHGKVPIWLKQYTVHLYFKMLIKGDRS